MSAFAMSSNIQYTCYIYDILNVTKSHQPGTITKIFEQECFGIHFIDSDTKVIIIDASNDLVIYDISQYKRGGDKILYKRISGSYYSMLDNFDGRYITTVRLDELTQQFKLEIIDLYPCFEYFNNDVDVLFSIDYGIQSTDMGKFSPKGDKLAIRCIGGFDLCIYDMNPVYQYAKDPIKYHAFNFFENGIAYEKFKFSKDGTKFSSGSNYKLYGILNGGAISIAYNSHINLISNARYFFIIILFIYVLSIKIY